MTSRHDQYGMDEARVSQRYSKDPSIQVGCAIIGPGGEVRADWAASAAEARALFIEAGVQFEELDYAF